MAIYKIEIDRPAVVTETYFVEASSLEAAVVVVEREYENLTPHGDYRITDVDFSQEELRRDCSRALRPAEVPEGACVHGMAVLHA